MLIAIIQILLIIYIFYLTSQQGLIILYKSKLKRYGHGLNFSFVAPRNAIALHPGTLEFTYLKLFKSHKISHLDIIDVQKPSATKIKLILDHPDLDDVTLSFQNTSEKQNFQRLLRNVLSALDLTRKNRFSSTKDFLIDFEQRHKLKFQTDAKNKIIEYLQEKYFSPDWQQHWSLSQIRQQSVQEIHQNFRKITGLKYKHGSQKIIRDAIAHFLLKPDHSDHTFGYTYKTLRQKVSEDLRHNNIKCS